MPVADVCNNDSYGWTYCNICREDNEIKFFINDEWRVKLIFRLFEPPTYPANDDDNHRYDSVQLQGQRPVGK